MSDFQVGDRVKIIRYADSTDNAFVGVVGSVLGHGKSGEWIEIQPDRSPYPGWVQTILCERHELEAAE